MPATKKKVDIAAVVAQATILARQIKADGERLDELKATLREHAEAISIDGQLVELDSPEGTCTVVFPGNSIILKKGADPYTIQDRLTEQEWDALFIEKATLSSEFSERFAWLNATKTKLVGNLIEERPNAPRVTLAK
jgi:hypothetical protein